MIKKLGLIVSGALSGTALLYLSLPWMATAILPVILKQNGLENVELNVSSLGVRGFFVPSFSVLLPFESGTIKADGRDCGVTYSLTSRGVPENVKIELEGLDLTIEHTQQGSSASQKAAGTLDLSRFSALGSIHIKVLTLDYKADKTNLTVLAEVFLDATERIRILLKQGDFKAGERFVKGLRGEFEFVNLLDPHSERASTLSFDLAKLPLPILNGKLRFSLLSTRALKLKLEQASLELLGASVSLQNLILQEPFQNFQVPLKLEQVSLAEIIKFRGETRIEGEGIFDGTLSLHSSPRGLEIKDGILTSREPGGYLNVSDPRVLENLALQHEALNILSKALQNYEFTSLIVGVNYETTGNLILDVSSKGSAPKINPGQEVNLNVKFEENVLSLLKSLETSGKIEKYVEQKFSRSTGAETDAK